jgi:hypothetical protein
MRFFSPGDVFPEACITMYIKFLLEVTNFLVNCLRMVRIIIKLWSPIKGYIASTVHLKLMLHKAIFAATLNAISDTKPC